VKEVIVLVELGLVLQGGARSAQRQVGLLTRHRLRDPEGTVEKVALSMYRKV
jgi:hypothetical protein